MSLNKLQKINFGCPDLYFECLALFLMLFYCFLMFGTYSKRRAPENDEECSEKCAEISHMRPNQGRKLKLTKVCIWGKLKLCHVSLPKITLIYLKSIPIQETSSGEGAPIQCTQGSVSACRFCIMNLFIWSGWFTKIIMIRRLAIGAAPVFKHPDLT